MQSMKREAPKLFRQFQTDVFTELSNYKKRVLNEMHTKLINSSKKMKATSMMDQREGTRISDIKKTVKVFKLDEFGREIDLGLPEV